MVHRHPHVFGDENRDKSASQQTADWEKIKAAERANKGDKPARTLDVEARDTLAHDAQVEEYGDLMFVMANLARHLKIDPEEALRSANRKFMRRFEGIEDRLENLGKSPAQSNLAEMDALWDAVKQSEKTD